VISRLRPWLPALVWATVLFELSTIPGSEIPDLPTPQFDKLVHGFLYAVLGICCLLGLRQTTSLGTRGLVAAATALATAFGVTDELHQLFTPRRSSDWHDVVADAVGALAGAVLATRFRRRPELKKAPPDAANTDG
jgi:VanZ family protein